ncbi:hypothetical protein A3K74_00355 [Candidatus Pacearchaeota archaeon RBG_13_33_26]|nr:MAG: hypothetical protein A3K74_00355 [Candidatus Pacearchaeota archaeon RBG_13_33_26]
MTQDAMQLKEKIISFIQLRGPSLPVHIAKETGLSILFASAFLSELFNEKRINISNLKVGSSPLYFISGQEPQLEDFSRYLKSKEKEAFLFLKEKRILRDSELHPAIRVALREIKDFAIPFRKGEEVYWRYFTIPEEEIRIVDNKPEEKDIIEIFEKKDSDKIEKEQKPEKKKKPGQIKQDKKKNQKKDKKKDENFFNRIKEFLDKKGVEILDIKDFKNDEAILKIKRKEEEILFVFNKKKITEKEILRAYKKASEMGMKYSILSFGETPKRLSDFISAAKSLSEIDRIE